MGSAALCQCSALTVVPLLPAEGGGWLWKAARHFYFVGELGLALNSTIMAFSLTTNGGEVKSIRLTVLRTLVIFILSVHLTCEF